MTPPPAARVAFGEQLPIAEAYVAWLIGPGVERGLLGPRESERIWERHLLNCAALAPELPQGATVADVGSGAGLPGIPLALARPDLDVTLIEPLLRRATFLGEVVEALGLPIRVLRARAEDVAEDFDVVVSRAVAPLDRLAGWCAPLLRPGGLLLALKGATAEDELATHAHGLGRVGLGEAVAFVLDDHAGGQATVIRATRVRAAGAPGRAKKTQKAGAR